MKSFGFLALKSVVLFWIPVFAFADSVSQANHQFPFEQQINLNTVYDTTHSKPHELLEIIKSHGIEIQVVKSDKKNSTHINPLFKSYPFAKLDLLKKAEFDVDTVGMFLSKDNGCCENQNDLILIRDTALTYDLIHEFLHSQLFVNGRNKDRVGDQFYMAHRTLNFRQQKIAGDMANLADSRWRKDILDSCQTYIDLLYRKLQESQTEEAIIEKLLAKYIDDKNIYTNVERRKMGLKYAENSINNAVDMFNMINQYLRVNKGTVISLREAIVNQKLIPEFDQKLSESETKDFVHQTDKLLLTLDPIKKEILKLQDFFKNQ